MNKIIMVGGSKGGTGKSTVCSAVLDYLESQGKEPVLIETDTANPDVYNKIFALRYLERECKTIWKGKRIYIIPDALLHREKFSLSPTNESVLSLPENAKLLY